MLCCCCRDSHKGSERPGLGLETTEVSLFSNRMFWAAAAEGALVSFFFSFSCFLPKRKKKEPVVWNHATYKQAVRKAMFARFNELDWKWSEWTKMEFVNIHAHTHGVVWSVGSSFQALICELIQNSWRSLLWLTPHFVVMVMCACIKSMHSFLTAKCTLFNHSSCSSILQGFLNISSFDNVLSCFFSFFYVVNLCNISFVKLNIWVDELKHFSLFLGQ